MKPLTGLMARAEAALHSLQADGCVDRGGIAQVIRDLMRPQPTTVFRMCNRHEGMSFTFVATVTPPSAYVCPVCERAASGGIYRCEKHGGIGFVSDCVECATEIEGTKPDSTGTA